MRKRIAKFAAVATVVVSGMAATQGAALAGAPPVVGPGDGAFLCPAVGNENAAGHNGQEWFPINAGYSFLPGHNQAGAHASENAHNAEGPADSPGPGGGNSDWSPIWPPAE